MSLDVYLRPNKCPYCGRADEGFSQNITHNLGAMADEAGSVSGHSGNGFAGATVGVVRPPPA